MKKIIRRSEVGFIASEEIAGTEWEALPNGRIVTDAKFYNKHEYLASGELRKSATPKAVLVAQCSAARIAQYIVDLHNKAAKTDTN